MNRFLRFLFVFCITGTLSAAPFEDWFEHTLRNGKTVKIWGSGDEYSAVFEDAGGYTILWDADAGVYRYATRDSQSGALLPSALILGIATPAEIAQTIFEMHLRDTSEAAREATRKRIEADPTRELREARWESIRQASAAREEAAKEGSLKAPPASPTIGTVTGLTLLVDFPILDAEGTITNTLANTQHPDITRDVLDQFINGENFTSFGNAGSVRKYYEEVSNGNLCVTNIVIGYVLAPNPRSYYDVSTRDNGQSGRMLIGDVFTALKARPDFTTVIYPQLQQVSYSGSYFSALNIFFAGPRASVWSYGLWAHKWNLASTQRNLMPVSIGGTTRYFNTYQISPITSNPEIGTFCHENGHMVCAFPDLYDYESDSVGGAGYYCLMGSGGHTGNPVRVCAYLRAAAGWVTPQLIPRTGSGTLSVTAGSDGADCVWKWANPANSKEYFLLENRKKINRDSQIKDGGICIWHVDEQGNRDNQSRLYNTTHANYEVSCEQADGLYHFERNSTSNDSLDFWFSGNTAAYFKNAFNDLTTPNARWWNGTASGLSLSDFSQKDSSMTFAYGPAEDLAVSLPEALDWPEAILSQVGAAAWIGERFPDIAFDGIDCVRSGAIGHNEAATLSTTLTGPGEFSFYWNISSEKDYDFFTFSDNGTELINVSGTTNGWQRTTLTFSDSAAHTLVWRYTKDSSTVAGMDCVMLDRFVWRDWETLQKPLIENFSATAAADAFTAAFTLPDAGYGAESVEVTLEVSRRPEFSVIDAASSGTFSASSSEQTLTATGTFIPNLPYFLRLVARNNLGKTSISETRSLICIPSVAASLGVSARIFTEGGAEPWSVVYGMGPDGSEQWFARSGQITHSQESILETTLSGTGTLTFWWSCSSETSYDKLTCLLDGTEKSILSGEIAWKKITIPVTTAGTHTFTWRYAKDVSVSSGSDCGRLAAVRWEPTGAPSFELSALEITPDSITVRADVASLGTSAVAGSLVVSCEAAQASKTLSATGPHDFVLSGLTPNTLYTVNAALTNNLGVAMLYENPFVVATAHSVLTAPAIGLAGGGNPLGLAVNADGAEIFTVAILTPVTGVYYTPFAAATPGGTYTAGAASTLASDESALILAVPTGNAPRLFVKVVASLTPFAPGDSMP